MSVVVDNKKRVANSPLTGSRERNERVRHQQFTTAERILG
jgi:hypothetical protein